MKLPRRRFLRLAAGAAALPAVSHIAGAQTYPARPVHIIVGFPPGGATDIVARLIGKWLSERLGQQFLVENRPGAGGNIGTEVVVRAPADGYTLLLVNPANAINATLYEKLNFNFISDIAPVASIVRAVYLMEVNPSVPAKTVRGQRQSKPCGGRDIQNDAWRQYAPRALSRRRTCGCRSAGRTGSGNVRHRVNVWLSSL